MAPISKKLQQCFVLELNPPKRYVCPYITGDLVVSFVVCISKQLSNLSLAARERVKRRHQVQLRRDSNKKYVLLRVRIAIRINESTKI